EIAMCRRAAGVDHPLRDALMVEVGHLLTEDEILHQRWPAHAGLERVLVVADTDPLVGGQVLTGLNTGGGHVGVQRVVGGGCTIRLARLGLAGLGLARLGFARLAWLAHAGASS